MTKDKDTTTDDVDDVEEELVLLTPEQIRDRAVEIFTESVAAKEQSALERKNAERAIELAQRAGDV